MPIRLDPSQLSSEHQRVLQQLLESDEKPFLSIGNDQKVELPDRLYHFLQHLLTEMKNGNSMVLLSENEEFTTQVAANFLGMSRQFLVTLVESGKIPFRKVGTHRRIRYQDLKNYQEQRDEKRKEALNDYFSEVDELDLYDTVVK